MLLTIACGSFGRYLNSTQQKRAEEAAPKPGCGVKYSTKPPALCREGAVEEVDALPLPVIKGVDALHGLLRA